MSDADSLAFRLARGGVSVLLIGEVLKILVEKGVLTEGEAMARLERLSAECMAAPTGASAGEAVSIIQIVRDMVAGEAHRKPS
ncbi:MAG: hypothetical protein ABSE22_20015 [Xanthobacteraceae bacterium]|jgi:hypothetical protein